MAFDSPWDRGVSRRDWLGAAALGAATCLAFRDSTALGSCEDDLDQLDSRIFMATFNRPPLTHLNGLGVLDLKSGTWSKLTEERPTGGRVSADGNLVAHVKIPESRNLDETSVWLFDVKEQKDLKCVFQTPGLPFWSSDSRRLLIQEFSRTSVTLPAWLVALDGQKRERVPLEDTDHVLDWASDGQRILVASGRDQNLAARRVPNWPIEVVNVDGTRRRRLRDSQPETRGGLAQWQPKFLNNGLAVAYFQFDPKTETYGLWRVDVDGQNRACVLPAAKNESPFSCAVAPDGKHMAIAFMTFELGDDGKPDQRTAEDKLAILDVNGEHRREVPLVHNGLQLLDWRPAER
jgi:hypothetical protein